MKHTMVAISEDNLKNLFIGIKEFQIEKIIIVSIDKTMDNTKLSLKELKKFNIPVKIMKTEGSWSSIFKIFSDIKAANENVLVNISTAKNQCPAICAAFVNGLKAFSVNDGEVNMLPTLNFSYYKLIPEKKLEILRVLRDDKTCCASFDELSKKLKMSLPLVSYHINGSRKSEGLANMGLVEVNEKKGRLSINLTMLGKIIIDSCPQR
ncbi:MAG: winged helix-turn-helix transcriptional regulator [Candidatus Aenigmarchaeota archaeon]|nr:winged helix-turn-helix transcriptional regulator [Candidatus Aenigmarchaeota archaeon]